MASSLKFIVDESTGAAVVELLRRSGHDIVSIAETMPQAKDDDILNKVVNKNRILVTNDKDFGELIYRSGRDHAGVILLRLHDERPENRVRVTVTLLDRYSNRLSDNFIVATEKKVRIRSPRFPKD
jgi:predicted nuclease of predicted toxin-antitoxin system